MADEFQDDEYHFSDSGEPEGFDEDEIKSSIVTTTATTQLKRVIIAGVSVLIFALLGYNAIKSKGSSETLAEKPKETKVVKKTSATRVQKPVQQQPTVVQTAPEPVQMQQPTFVPVSSEPSPKVMRRISRASRDAKQAKSEVNQLTNKLGEVRGNVSKTEAELAALNRNLEMLAKQVMAQRAELKTLKEEKKKKAQMAMKKPPEKQMKYYVQAAVPGRAWLLSSRGDTVTVAIGVSLPEYGTVKTINAKKGEVTTSSGKMITFSPEDI